MGNYTKTQINTENTNIFKICNNTQKIEEYRNIFDLELKKMNELEELMGESYHKLFPRYIGRYETADGLPYLSIEYIKGVNLESWLNEKVQNNPRNFLLNKKKIIHLFNQIFEAEKALERVGLLQYDLNPNNIIITNISNFEIKLIDFTDCYYIPNHPANCKINRPREPKIMEALHLSKNDIHKPSFLTETCYLLLTRLCYSGNFDYTSNYNLNDQDTRLLFSQFTPSCNTNNVNVLERLSNWMALLNNI